jgi:hypothetical protein
MACAVWVALKRKETQAEPSGKNILKPASAFTLLLFVLLAANMGCGENEQYTSSDSTTQLPSAESQPEHKTPSNGIQACIDQCIVGRQIEAVSAEIIRTECQQRCTRSDQWVSYTNLRFGTTADYPADIFTVLDPPPGNGGGQGFQTEDGRAQLGIYAARNVENDTPQSYIGSYVDLKGSRVTYKHLTDRFFVVSGTREGKIFYTRCNFSADPEGIIDCLSISYPEAEKTEWDAIVTRLSESLRAGNGAERR